MNEKAINLTVIPVVAAYNGIAILQNKIQAASKPGVGADDTEIEAYIKRADAAIFQLQKFREMAIELLSDDKRIIYKPAPEIEPETPAEAAPSEDSQPAV